MIFFSGVEILQRVQRQKTEHKIVVTVVQRFFIHFFLPLFVRFCMSVCCSLKTSYIRTHGRKEFKKSLKMNEWHAYAELAFR